VIGQTLAHYKILEKIGSGGMGDVYLAEDTKLDRKVALKVLPPELAESEERRARFKREAKALAALDHPNIVQVFSVDEAEGVHFITMQLVRGKTLTELRPKNGFPLNKFFDIAIPMTDAVAAAHQEGITHRDLKPDNMMVGDDGRIRVLDFGLVKPAAGFAVNSEGPTAAKTGQGVIVGTVNYMSPEQAQGKTVDARSDIFSLGVVFYEMLTGRRPFGGESSTAILSAILQEAPTPVREHRREIPQELARIVGRCLAKEPNRRIQTALDIRNELEALKADLASGVLQVVAPSSVRPTARHWVAAGLSLTLILAAVLFYLVRTRAPRIAVTQLGNPVRLTSAEGLKSSPTWSPDGGRLAYEADPRGDRDIWVTQLGGGTPVNLTANHIGPDRYPSWSPDGREIAFLSQRNETWGLYTLPAVGGSARKVVSVQLEAYPTGAPNWSDDGAQIAVPIRDAGSNFVEIVTLRTQETRRIALPEHGGNRVFDLSWSPDGRYFAYVTATFWANEVTQLWIVSAAGGEPIPVSDGFSGHWSPTWSADGTKLFFASGRGGTMELWEQRIEDGKPQSDAEPVTTGVGIREAVFSRDGAKLAYSRARRESNVWRVPIDGRLATWAEAEQITFDNAFVSHVGVSPDGKRVVITSNRTGLRDLWFLPSEGGEMVQFTTDPSQEGAPEWSPDGTEIVFWSYRSGNRDLWIKPADGGPAKQLTSDHADDFAAAWSPDGREIAFVSKRSGFWDVWVVAVGGGEPRQLTADAGENRHPVWSPDGEWVVFQSLKEGRFVQWRVPAAGGEPEQLTEGPGQMARWSPDGNVLYFTGWHERAGNLWAMSMEDGREYPVTDLVGRRGAMGLTFSMGGEYLYFTWWEDIGDIWVMDVVTNESE